MHVDDLRQRLREHGAAPRHESLLIRQWLQTGRLDGGPRPLAGLVPRTLLDALPALQQALDALARVRSVHPASDGSARLLVELSDGQAVESVLLPRDGACVSTQLGCAVGCAFCMTGRGGLLRQLGSAEIVAQAVLARRMRPLRKLVFMGMGEPSHNLDAVMDAIGLLGTAGGIGHKNLVFSTVGDRRAFERLPLGPVRPALALSLHTTHAALRETLLPRAPRIDPDELTALAGDYARATGYPVQYQWTLLEGVNDGDDEIEGIVRLLAGQYAVMNLIPYNAVDDLPFRRPSWQRAVDMARALRERGVLATLRESAGQEVDGGCGQLRARAAQDGETVVRVARRAPSVRAGGA